MFNLLDATKDYWRKLDELEAAYQRGEVSLAEVNTKVPELIAELSRERRAAIALMQSSWSRVWREHQQAIIGTVAIGVLTYAWMVAELV
ncbi:hypothetical protein H6F88_09960 [Oculatella sp. FACHB-28]|uniref:hypothetical protein n=1 Tax=Cyanophyceae TaxID=3028117 RepID=UPI0016837C70|nr:MULTISPECIES: hypothetical protein [Cyanophyceae]MBD1866223.1 hypothetical protein [Cyanobacteria bacterium FACHB-471]MBD2001179.1 hypothetical protein [Leptolyngbya sp. FACHB-541]MBD2056340.1 hypothetical protein [Oculatella sp. FACHB-28]MBD2070690.1 hypothetical protein [Leptolyngbya sp. FACHB-671]